MEHPGFTPFEGQIYPHFIPKFTHARWTLVSASKTDCTESSHPHLKCPSGQRFLPCIPQGRQGNSEGASTTAC